MWSWEKGRQGTGYEKLLLYQFSVMGCGFDCYLLRYETNHEIPAHTDPVAGKKHYRLNLELKQAMSGGKLLFYKKRRWVEQGKLVFFRSDLQPHKVTKVLAGNRLVLTFGAAL